MGDFLRFRRMVTPLLIQLLFWLGVLAAVVGGVITMVTESVLLGLAVLIIAPILIRVYAELLIVLFRIHSALQRMAAQLEARPAGPGGAPSGPGGGFAAGPSGPQPGPQPGPQAPQGPQTGAPQGGPRPPGPGAPPPPGGYTPGG